MLHADAMPQIKPKRYYADVSQTHKDLTNNKYRNLRRPKKVTFFCNGDKFFKGKKFFITPHRYLSFQDLLGDLTGKLPTTASLPYGVRQIYTPSGGRRIRDIEHLQDGREYVCAGFESFKSMNYGISSLDPWSHGEYGLGSNYRDINCNNLMIENHFITRNIIVKGFISGDESRLKVEGL